MAVSSDQLRCRLLLLSEQGQRLDAQAGGLGGAKFGYRPTIEYGVVS